MTTHKINDYLVFCTPDNKVLYAFHKDNVHEKLRPCVLWHGLFVNAAGTLSPKSLRGRIQRGTAKFKTWECR